MRNQRPIAANTRSTSWNIQNMFRSSMAAVMIWKPIPRTEITEHSEAMLDHNSAREVIESNNEAIEQSEKILSNFDSPSV